MQNLLPRSLAKNLKSGRQLIHAIQPARVLRAQLITAKSFGVRATKYM